MRHNSFDCSVLGSKIVGPLYECTNVPGLFLSMEAYAQQLVPKNKKAAPYIFKAHLMPVEVSNNYTHKVCQCSANIFNHFHDSIAEIFRFASQFDKFGSLVRSTVQQSA